MKRIIILLVAMSLLASLALPVHAAMEEAPFADLEEVQDIVIWIEWDVEQPTVVFLAPDGREYDPTVATDDTASGTGENALYYTIRGAQAGQWNVRYDKGNNTQLDITIQEFATPLYIDYLTLDSVSGDRLPVRFLVSSPEGEEDRRYQYRISAMVDHTGVEKSLYDSYAYTGSEESVTVDLSSLASHSAYLLKLYVWYEQDGAEIFDFVFSDPFSYTNSDADSQAKDFDLTVAPENGLIWVTMWDLSRYTDSVMVAVFENGEAEPAMFDEYQPDQLAELQLAYDPTATEVAVEVAVEYDGIYAAPVRKSFTPSKLGISIPEGNAFNSQVLPISYTGMSGQLVDIAVNSDHNEVVLTGDGSLDLSLIDDWNALKISYTDSQGIHWLLERDIYIDRVPPLLTMSQNYDNMTTQETTLTITGTVSDYHSVTVNGQTATVDANGLFSLDLALTEGANTVEVVASDKLGNQARYTAQVFCGTTQEEYVATEEAKEVPGGLLEVLAGPGSFWPLLISSGFCLVILVYAFIFWRKEGKK